MPEQTRKASDPYLCSVELHAPSQTRKADSFAIFANVAFDVRRKVYTVESDKRTIRYGFHAAEIWLETIDCRKAPQGRFYEDLTPVKVKFEEVRDKERSGGFEGGFAAAIPAAVKVLTGKIGLNGKLREGMTQKIVESGETEIICSVVQRHNDYWRLFGYKNQEGVLVGQIVGDSPLCDIVDEGEGGTIRASLRVDLQDLFLEIEGGVDPAGANRAGVCTALISKRLKRRGEEIDVDLSTGVIELASDQLVVGPKAPAHG
jgi:hypothetical protein